MRGKLGLRIVLLILVLGGLFALPRPVYADVAPPAQPPGSDIDPGGAVTQVRMAQETVLLDVQTVYPESSQGQALVDAQFTMRNLGDAGENLAVRFPLTDVSGEGDGFGNMPEIQDLAVWVDGAAVETSRNTTPNPSAFLDTPIPWAVFPVAFPVGQDVIIEVRYTAEATAHQYDPAMSFSYILETGAGWRDTIGSADIIVRLPYEASPDNVLDSSGFQFDQQMMPVFSGQEARWHLENFEPDTNYNFRVIVTRPALWQPVLVERQNVQNNPNDGEAWGRLGMAYKHVIDSHKFYRADPAGIGMFFSSIEAYDRAVSLLPNDALWHFGFSQLLFVGYDTYSNNEQFMAENGIDPSLLARGTQELYLSLQLDPNNQEAIDLANWVAVRFPGWIEGSSSNFGFIGLTAPPTPVVTETSTPEATPSPTATSQPIIVTSATPIPATSGEKPLCSSVFLAISLVVIVFSRKVGPRA